jgi:hypothetical protein
MGDNAYNGWEGNGSRESAYATWRVNLELGFGDRDDWADAYDEKPDAYDLAESIKAEAEEWVCGDDPDANDLRTQYALAFLDDVSWYEIAENILLGWPEDEEES